MQLGVRKLRGSVNGDEEVELIGFGAHFGNVDVEIPNRIALELLLRRLLTL